MSLDLNNVDNQIQTTFQAIYKGQENILKDLLIKNRDLIQIKDKEGNSLLHRAAEEGNIEMINFLLDKGCEINLKTTDLQATPLHLAIIAGKEEAAALLIRRGADQNCVDRDQETPLHVACLFNRLSAVKALNKTNDLLTAKNKFNETPFDIAYTNNIQIAKYLAQENGNVLLRNAIKKKNLNTVQALINSELKHSLQLNSIKSPSIKKLLIDYSHQ